MNTLKKITSTVLIVVFSILLGFWKGVGWLGLHAYSFARAIVIRISSQTPTFFRHVGNFCAFVAAVAGSMQTELLAYINTVSEFMVSMHITPTPGFHETTKIITFIGITVKFITMLSVKREQFTAEQYKSITEPPAV